MSASPRRQPAPNSRVPVWDAAVRVFHWSLAASVVFNLVRDDGDFPHRAVGYAAAGIVAARLLWAAFPARGWNRLSALKPSVSRTLDHMRRLSQGHSEPGLGHNPLGQWMAWLLWALVALLALTGWMSRLDAFWGDERLHDLHARLADALMVAAAVHVAGVAVMGRLHRMNYVAAMITGRKPALPAPDKPADADR